MIKFVFTCIFLATSLIRSAEGSVSLQFDLKYTVPFDCRFAQLRLIQTTALNGMSVSTPLVNFQSLMINGIESNTYNVSISEQDTENSIISFTWTANNDASRCCWSVSNIKFMMNSSYNRPINNSCIFGNPAYNCSGGDIWLCSNDQNSNAVRSQLITDSFNNFSRGLGDIKLNMNCNNDMSATIIQTDADVPTCFDQQSTSSSSVVQNPSTLITANSVTSQVVDISLTATVTASSDSLEIMTSTTSIIMESPSMNATILVIPTNGMFESAVSATGAVTNMMMESLSLSATSVSAEISIPVSASNTPVPSVIMREKCDQQGIWMETPVGSNITLNDVSVCYKGAANGTRRCNDNGEWSEVYCMVSRRFTETLEQISAESPKEGLNTVLNLLSSSNGDISFRQYQFLIETVLEDVDDIVSTEFIQVLLEVEIELITMIQMETNLSNTERRRIGALILQSLDDFSLTYVQPSNDTISFNDTIFLTVTEFTNAPTKNVTVLTSEQNSITLPPNVFGKTVTEPVRIGSFLFRNLSILLPPRNTNTSIISPVISSTTNCRLCPVTNFTENVTISLQLKESPSNRDRVSCVFFQFESSDIGGGDWNTSGCTTVVNGDIVTCSCNHLTHFAILLSPGIEVDPIQYEVLTIIGLVLVPISLLCMIIVILTYTFMRSLWSIRNYIHIMLCVSLFMAQLVFIIGVDKIKNEGACSAVAVLLQYLFLVTFMWMLMEGVVLYVTLVRVFIHNHKYYIIAFTVASYGVPAVYLMLVVPLGFLIGVNDISGHTHYLYYVNNDLVACWLNTNTGFISAFIVPVCLIIMANIGFFIMAIVIMRKHFKKQDKKRATATVKHWLKASISLTLVMGITWITGLLAYSNSLIAVAYVYTVFVAGQGIILFIILVPLSKQVRTSYMKLFRQRASGSGRISKFLSSMITSTSTLGHSSNKQESSNEGRKASGGIKLGTFGDTDTVCSNGTTSSPLPPNDY